LGRKRENLHVNLSPIMAHALRQGAWLGTTRRGEDRFAVGEVFAGEEGESNTPL